MRNLSVLPGPTQGMQSWARHPVRGSCCLPTGSVQEQEPVRRLPQAAAPRMGLQLTPSFTFQRCRAHFS